jgi:hypothetical protein
MTPQTAKHILEGVSPLIEAKAIFSPHLVVARVVMVNQQANFASKLLDLSRTLSA